MNQLLVVEDDRALSSGICLALKGEGTSLTQCFDLSSARGQLSNQSFDLIILDIMMKKDA